MLQATAINMTDMVGIGPFITLPVVVGMVHGASFLWAWIVGAVLSLVDASIWAELGAALPKAGGSYNFLKEAYGKNEQLINKNESDEAGNHLLKADYLQQNRGGLLPFLFVWQTCIQAPLVIASAAIGFSSYLSWFYPLGFYQSKAISGLVVIMIVLLLYRNIETIGKISVLLWMGVLITMACIIGGGIYKGQILQPLLHINDGMNWNLVTLGLIGGASVKTVYSYLGYYNVCHLGGEIINPSRNIPRSMFISIIGITILYLGMNMAVTSVIPWQKVIGNNYVVSSFIETIGGHTAAAIITILILWVAFASVFSATLGYSRIPYAAAADGRFFPIFAKLHPTKNFPYMSILILGGVAFVFSLLFRIEQVISAILAMRILVQFIGQAIGLMLLRNRKPASFFPYKMPLYPVPVLLAILLWAFIFVSTGKWFMLGGIIVIASGVLAFFLINKRIPENRIQ